MVLLRWTLMRFQFLCSIDRHLCMQAFPCWQWFSSACFSGVGLVGQRCLMFLCFLIHFAEMLFRRATYLSTLPPIRMSPKGKGREAPAHGPPVSMGGPGSQPRSTTMHGMQLHFFPQRKVTEACSPHPCPLP